jgi:hypothetical protein
VKEADIQRNILPSTIRIIVNNVGKIKVFAGGDAAVINTINGDSNVPFFKELTIR